jgi:hypothetical protein
MATKKPTALERLVRAEAALGMSMKECGERTGHDRSKAPEESRLIGGVEYVGRCCPGCGLWKAEREANVCKGYLRHWFTVKGQPSSTKCLRCGASNLNRYVR